MNASHYPSLELCKNLTEAGFPATEMYIGEYRHTQLNKEFEVTIRDSCYAWDYETFRNVWFCPSVMELLDAIPTELEYENGTLSYLWMSIDRWVWYNWFHIVDYWTLPNALAEMWLWLKENKYLS